MATTLTAEARKEYGVLQDAKPTTIIIACPDPKFHLAVRGFIEEELGLGPGQYLLLGELGGVLPLTEIMTPHALKHMEEIIRFCFEEISSLQNAVVLNHADCRRYKYFHTMLGGSFLQGHDNLQLRQCRDLRLAERRITHLASRKIAVTQYYQKWSDEERTRVYFEKIN